MMKILMLGGTGAIGESILSIIGNDDNYSITVTSRRKRESNYRNVQYLCGNANDLQFINTFPDQSYDVLVDFMNYRNEILESNISKLLQIADQYMFLSSARVYDNSQEIIDENCSLLLDTTESIDLKNSGTYAVKKAYQERFVLKNGGRKVTIIRPYKTYSAERLQLGEYEIKHWLQRMIHHKPIVLNKEILTKHTSLTDGLDVARGMIGLMGNRKAFGQTYQIVTNESMTWEQILELYVGELKKRTIVPRVYLSDDTKEIDKLFEAGYQMPFDIMYDRRFNSSKISEIIEIPYRSMREGLSEALSKYLDTNVHGDFQPSEYDGIVDRHIAQNHLSVWEDKLHA